MKKSSRDRRKDMRFYKRCMRWTPEDRKRVNDSERLTFLAVDLYSEPNGTIAHFDKPGILKD